MIAYTEAGLKFQHFPKMLERLFIGRLVFVEPLPPDVVDCFGIVRGRLADGVQEMFSVG
jgi:hypothetical protein